MTLFEHLERYQPNWKDIINKAYYSTVDSIGRQEAAMIIAEACVPKKEDV